MSESRNANAIRLIVGLGNPGDEYAETYHNIGFRVVDRMAAEVGARFRQKCGPALISDKIMVAGQPAVLVKPQTYMNLSGETLRPLFDRFEAGLADVIVVYDDLALPVGKIRVRQKGSAGGHNGLKSLISAAGSDEFMRVRIGILPDHPVGDVRAFVLSRVAKSSRELLEKAEETAARAVETLIADGIERAMAAYNGVDLKEREETAGDKADRKSKDI